MRKLRKQSLSLILILVMAITLVPSMSVSATEVLLNVGQSRQIPLGANLYLGKQVSGTWTISNSSVARITSQSPSYCTVLGVSAGTATFRCNYKYYVGGTYVTSSWSCYVTVSGSGSSSGGGSSTNRYLYFSDGKTEKTVIIDIAKEYGKSVEDVVYISPSVGDDKSYWIGLSSSKGYDSTLEYSGEDLPNGRGMKFKIALRYYARDEIGEENLTFYLLKDNYESGTVVSEKTNYSPAKLNLVVMCSHEFNNGYTIQKPSATQNKIVKYTCKHCGETKTEEFETEKGDATGDGEINSNDLLRLGKYLSGWDVELSELGADVTGDGKVNSMDLLRLGKYFAGWDVTLGE